MLLVMLFCPQLYPHKCDIVLTQGIEACVIYFSCQYVQGSQLFSQLYFLL